MKNYVAQWKCNRWVNHTDEKEKALLFDTVEKAEAFIEERISEEKSFSEREGSIHKERQYRIAEKVGARKYIEVKQIRG